MATSGDCPAQFRCSVDPQGWPHRAIARRSSAVPSTLKNVRIDASSGADPQLQRSPRVPASRLFARRSASKFLAVDLKLSASYLL
ncbi:hypothetical protein M378DRAFT_159541 [Amanita muscaria Koide BX008]|uniref:Uncharacterized protein n=1 Tax=Amanita muscaria (strain Koide BX008) TaxID=946122 RepID=A0A0C2X0R7_AMAMK|nr:hypothetical protein M378DRAFT_159541 [Amanita muscaria Koide BX008]